MSRRRSGEEFEFYVVNQLESFDYYFSTLNNFRINCEKEFREEFKKINERLDKMATLAEQLGVEETTLAEVVPQLATEITTLQSSLTEKETSIKTDLETVAQDEASIATKNAELAAIQKVQEQLAPVVEKAKSLVPAPVVAPPAPVTEPTPQPVTPPAEPAPAVPPTNPGTPAA